jgi:hypothetical protein
VEEGVVVDDNLIPVELGEVQIDEWQFDVVKVLEEVKL